MTDEQLQQCLSFWQEKLRLRDWKIACRIGNTKETRGRLGISHISSAGRTAEIILAPENAMDHTRYEYEVFPENRDPEMVLIHELVHVVLDAVWDDEMDDYEEILREQAIEGLTSALYVLSQ